MNDHRAPSAGASEAADHAEAPPSCDLDAAAAWARARLAAAGIASAAGDARRLLDWARAGPEGSGGLSGVLDRTACDRLARAVAERARRRPVSQIIGLRAFYKYEFETGPDVLDPRPESEALVEAALDFWPEDARGEALDLGVGSGCLLLSVLAERPGLQGLGVDASAAALAVAGRNADRLGLGARCRLVRGDWDAGIVDRFDVILCNPPYISLEDWRGLDIEVRAYEPKAALTPGRDALMVYRRVAAALSRLLKPEGRVFFEVGKGQSNAVRALLEKCGAKTETRRDLGGVERLVSAWLPVGREDAVAH